jgi:4-methyl-5(b-hydroxyethyl)-thiazole monophosphate biosynthesis
MGLYVAAICAGPRVLSKIGVLDGKKAVCYPGMEDQMTGNMSQKSSTVVDGKVVTGRAAGASLDFAFTLLELLKDKETADKVRHGIHYGEK